MQNEIQLHDLERKRAKARLVEYGYNVELESTSDFDTFDAANLRQLVDEVIYNLECLDTTVSGSFQVTEIMQNKINVEILIEGILHSGKVADATIHVR